MKDIAIETFEGECVHSDAYQWLRLIFLARVLYERSTEYICPPFTKAMLVFVRLDYGLSRQMQLLLPNLRC
jgi:hypothetical protein